MSPAGPSPGSPKAMRPFGQRTNAVEAEHPFWGYPRNWTYLRRVDGIMVSKTRVSRLQREHRRHVKPNLWLKATRTGTRSKPRPSASTQWCGIDVMKVLVEPVGGSTFFSARVVCQEGPRPHYRPAMYHKAVARRAGHRCDPTVSLGRERSESGADER